MAIKVNKKAALERNYFCSTERERERERERKKERKKNRSLKIAPNCKLIIFVRTSAAVEAKMDPPPASSKLSSNFAKTRADQRR